MEPSKKSTIHLTAYKGGRLLADWVKFENSIDRLTATANPRQIERVPAGAEFNFKLVYNIENEEEYKEDMEIFADGIKLLTMDYLGGNGSRGYGRVSFRNFKVEAFSLNPEKIFAISDNLDSIKERLSAGGLL